VRYVIFFYGSTVNFLQKTINHFIMVPMPRNNISGIIFIHKLPLQPVMLGLGLGLKAKIFGLGLEA